MKATTEFLQRKKVLTERCSFMEFMTDNEHGMRLVKVNELLQQYSDEQNKYLKTKCELLEKIEKNNPCDPDITEGQIEAYKNYNNFINQ